LFYIPFKNPEKMISGNIEGERVVRIGHFSFESPSYGSSKPTREMKTVHL